MIVNLNVLCKVYLNDFGKQIWLSQIDSLPEELIKHQPDVVTAIQSKIQPDSSIELELWQIMQIFGPAISMSRSPFKINTLDLDKNPNFGNFFHEEITDEI